MRVGILGGVFNPPHLGHLVCAQEAHTALGLDRVLMVPVGEAPHREVDADPGPETRLALCEAAVAGDARLETSRIELDRPGPSYTADTLEELARQRPDDELVLLLGGDEAAALGGWHEPERVLASATVAAVERERLRREDVCERVAGIAGADRLEFFAMPRIDISSTLVRRRVARGLPIRYLVPDGVAALIEERGLYRAAGGGDPSEAGADRSSAPQRAPGTIATGAGST